MKKIRILAVGKIRTPWWERAIREYRGKLARAYTIEETLARDGNPCLSVEARMEEEGRMLAQKLRPGDRLICLDERGCLLTSPQFAGYLNDTFENRALTPCFIVGGAFGLSAEIADRAHLLFSLGRVTLTHELARVVLWEQLYRAHCINAKIPYHHG